MEIIGKRERNKQQRREAIVDVATRAFLHQGYAATSMSAIADEIGGSKATLWSHFGSKEELFSAVIDRLVEQFARQIAGTIEDDHFTLDGLHHYCSGFLQMLMGDYSVRLFRLIIADGARFPEIRTVFHARAPKQVERLLTGYFATRFEPDTAQRLARITNCAMVGYRSHALTRPEWPSEAEIKRFVDDFIAHLRLPDLDGERG